MGHAHHARKHYSQEQALEWIIQIAKGLRYLHTSKPKVHAFLCERTRLSCTFAAECCEELSLTFTNTTARCVIQY